MFTDSFADLRTGYPFTILYMAIVGELVGAYYLYFGRDLTIKWLLMARLFGLFLGITFIRYAIGVTGCGCLGAVEIPRWVLPLNSILVVVGLVAFANHPRTSSLFHFRALAKSVVSKMASPAISGGVISLLLIVSGLIAFPFVRSTPLVNSFLGEIPMPAVRFAAGDLTIDESSDLTILWRNESSQRVVLVGSQSSCTCVGLTNAPLSADPSEQIELNVNVRPRKPGLFHQRIVCFVDHPQQDRLTLDVIANAVLPHKEF